MSRGQLKRERWRRKKKEQWEEVDKDLLLDILSGGTFVFALIMLIICLSDMEAGIIVPTSHYMLAAISEVLMWMVVFVRFTIEGSRV